MTRGNRFRQSAPALEQRSWLLLAEVASLIGCSKATAHRLRRGEIDGVEQLTRYLELLNRDPLLSPVRGVFAAQAIKPQARVLAEDRGIQCIVVDYDALRGVDDPTARLF